MAKFYTFLYAVIMTAVVVGTAEQLVDDLDPSAEKRNATALSSKLVSLDSIHAERSSINNV